MGTSGDIKSMNDFRKFLGREGVEESAGIEVFGRTHPHSDVKSVSFVHAPYQVVSEEFPNNACGEYMIEIKLVGHTPEHIRKDITVGMKNTVEARNSQDYGLCNTVNVYLPQQDSEETVLLIGTRNPESVMEFLEEKSVVIGAAASKAVKQLHTDVWPTFKDKFKKKR